MDRERIMTRMQEHLATVQERFGNAWVGLFLQGSQNYKLDYESSDIATKAIVLPSFSDFVPTSPSAPPMSWKTTSTWISRISGSCLSVFANKTSIS